MNFSVPDEVKRTFDNASAGRNKSAVIARLMSEAVEEEQRRERRAQAIEALLALRARAPEATDSAVRAAREADRP